MLDEVDTHRAHYYGLLARLLARPADGAFLAELGALSGDDSPMGRALAELAAAARDCDVEAATDEYTQLFYGMGQGGEVLPYGSYYLTGLLNDKPLAALRGDMELLGIAHAGRDGEPEDHIAYIFDMMAGLITGSFGIGVVELVAQHAFFDAHIGSWAETFFEDLEAAEAADFFRPVARLALLFLSVERQAFSMAA